MEGKIIEIAGFVSEARFHKSDRIKRNFRVIAVCTSYVKKTRISFKTKIFFSFIVINKSLCLALI